MMAHKQSKQFKHLSQEERIEIYRYKDLGVSNRKIGKIIARSHTTIGRELERNSTDHGRGNIVYKPIEAEKKKVTRKEKSNFSHIKLRKDVKLRTKIRSILSNPNNCWGVDEILGHLGDEGWKVVSTTTLYNYIRKYTDRAKYLRYHEDGYKYRKRKRTTTITIKGVPKIDKRPEIANERKRIGDWEVDTVLGKGHSGGLFTAVDRKSRYMLIAKIPNHKAQTLLTIMTAKFLHEKVSTITSDNGVEFAELAKLGRRLRIKPFTAHPYACYERGTNEKHNGFIRRFLPKGTDISEYTDQEIQKIQDMLNHKPRKILGYRTPYEIYNNTQLSYI